MKHDDAFGPIVMGTAIPRRPAPRAASLVARATTHRKGESAGRAGRRGIEMVATADNVSYQIYRLVSPHRSACPFRCTVIQRLAAGTGAVRG